MGFNDGFTTFLGWWFNGTPITRIFGVHGPRNLAELGEKVWNTCHESKC